MVQHLLITVVGPPLLLIGLPGWLIEPLLHQPVLFRIAKFLTFPPVAFVLFNADFWLWHAPPLYNATLSNEGLHILEHLSFMIFAFIYWWPVFSPSTNLLPRLPLGGQMLYIFVSGMPVVLLGAGLTFTPPLYAPYIQQPVRAWGISPTLDQQLGGLIMWIPGNILNIVIVSLLFIRWMRLQDEKQRQEEAARFALEDASDTEDEASDISEPLS
jgi:cytochrome c oxidase assembly factor CtaG